MKTFKNFISEGDAFYVRVQSGKALLCVASMVGPCTSFGRDVVSAVVQGDLVVTTDSHGATQLWRINPTSRTVVGPVKTT